MARLKTTVDWFPHMTKHGKTLHIIDNRFGNDGYSFWWRLLELLGRTEGHFYDCRDVMSQEFLAAETRVSADTCTEILDLLASLNAIDPKLWSARVIWCQNFVDGLKPVYVKRDTDLPLSPTFLPQKDGTADIPVTGSRIPSLSGDETKQSRVEVLEEEKNNVGFDTFWGLCPKRHGNKRLKPEAKAYWLKHISNGKAEKVLIGTRNYAESKDVKAGVGIRDPIRILKNDFFMQWQDPEETPTTKAGPKKSLDEFVAERNKREGVT